MKISFSLFDSVVCLSHLTPIFSFCHQYLRLVMRQKVRKVMDAYKSLLIETFQVENNRSCNICLKTFSKASYCREHMMSIHSESKKYQCDKCESKFSTRNGLKLDMPLMLLDPIVG